MIRKEVLDNGLILLTERMPHVRSVSLGVWLRKGSRHEPAAQNGISHFLEHLVFKGTQTRSARDIAKIIDRFGGYSDAFTSKEHTCFYANVLDEHLDVAVDLLSDIVLHPRFDPGEIEKERKVIFEEIRMVEDTPDELLFDLFAEVLWADHPLGRPIQGTQQTVTAMDRGTILDYFQRSYRSRNLILAAAGNVEHEELARQVRAAFDSLPAGDGADENPAPSPGRAAVLREKGELEQLHLCLGVPGFPIADPRRYAGRLFDTVLGGGMSSRLFQTLREDHGLAYAVQSSLACYEDTGYLVVYLATAPEQAQQALDLVRRELRAIRESEVSDEELQDAKEHLKGSLMLGLESSSNRMGNLARQEISFGRQATLDEVLQEIDKVTREEVLRLSRELIDGQPAALAALGRIGDSGLEAAPLPLD